MRSPRAVAIGVVVAATAMATCAVADAAGSGWTIQSTPHPTDAAAFNAVSCPSATSCTAVGAASGALAVRWNGTSWQSQMTPKPAAGTAFTLTAVSCPSTTDCTAVGQYINSAGFARVLADHWNGSSWTVQSIPTPSAGQQLDVSGLSCASTDACMMVGTYANSAGATVMLAERWNGTQWTIVPVTAVDGAKSSALSGVSCPSIGECVAVGSFGRTTRDVEPLSERWNGSSWTPSPAILSGVQSHLNAVSCPSSTSCDAVGWSAAGTNTRLNALDEHWNGTTWTVRPTPDPSGSRSSVLWGVSCSSSSACAAVGDDSGAGNASRIFAERWNGAIWATESMPSPTGAYVTSLDGVSCFESTACTAVGDTEYKDSRGQRTLAERHP
jgi:hypothetical protein